MLQGERITKMRVVKSAGLILGASIIGMLLLWAVYILPTESMVENVIKSETFLKEQDDSQYILSEEYWKATDRGTNIIILHEVIYPNTGDALQDALLSPTANYFKYWASDWAEVLMKYAKEQNYEADDYVSYARYWHGYLVLLKPLFMIFELQTIYIINAIILFGLTLWISFLMWKRLGIFVIPYIITILTMRPVDIVQSFQLSSVFYAMQITLLLLLYCKNLKKEQVIYLFVLDGILVAFLDFLTYPIVAVGIPLMTAYLLYKDKTIKENLFQMITNGVSFVLGYAGMWGMKWVLATLFTEENIILDAISSVLHRVGLNPDSTDGNFMSVGISDALIRNLTSYFNIGNCVLIIMCIICIGICLLFKRKKISMDMPIAITCFCVAVLPFVWIMVLYNHCSLHPHLEWRSFAVFIYAVFVFGISLFQDKQIVIEKNI